MSSNENRYIHIWTENLYIVDQNYVMKQWYVELLIPTLSIWYHSYAQWNSGHLATKRKHGVNLHTKHKGSLLFYKAFIKKSYSLSFLAHLLQ